MRRCIMTNDVETTSIINGGLRVETGDRVWKEGLPLILDIYAKYNIRATFFFIAKYAKRCPEIVTMVHKAGHEVALHGLTHDHKLSFDTMPYELQLEHLVEGKKILEDIAGEEVVSFRSPALRVNSDTPRALVEAGFRYDSSVAPQRLDMFMSLGSKNKMQWLKAPRTPYETAIDNLARRGDSGIIEVPVSSFGAPYIGTAMRVAPRLTKLTRSLVYCETKDTNKVVNFLIHPIELITEPQLNEKIERRSKNPISYLLADVIRHQLKLKNLGEPAVKLFEKEIEYWLKNNYDFVTIKDINGKEK